MGGRNVAFPSSEAENVSVLFVSAKLVYHDNQKLVQSPWGASVLFWVWLQSEFQSKNMFSPHNPWSDAGNGEPGWPFACGLLSLSF